jgi:hypothetical protein
MIDADASVPVCHNSGSRMVSGEYHSASMPAALINSNRRCVRVSRWLNRCRAIETSLRTE